MQLKANEKAEAEKNPKDEIESVDDHRMFREVQTNVVNNFMTTNIIAGVNNIETKKSIQSTFASKLRIEPKKSTIKEREDFERDEDSSNTFMADANAQIIDKTTTDIDQSVKFNLKLNLNDLSNSDNADTPMNLQTPKINPNLNLVPDDQKVMITSTNRHTERDTITHLDTIKKDQQETNKNALLKKDDRFFKNAKEIENIISTVVSDQHLSKV